MATEVAGQNIRQINATLEISPPTLTTTPVTVLPEEVPRQTVLAGGAAGAPNGFNKCVAGGLANIIAAGINCTHPWPDPLFM